MILENFHNGRSADCGPCDKTSDAAGDSRREVRASFILALLGQFKPTCRNTYLSLRGVRVTGLLDLRYADIAVPLEFHGCTFDKRLCFAEAKLPSLTISDCKVPKLDAEHLQVDGNLKLTKIDSRGPVILTGANVRSDLHLEGGLITCGLCIKDNGGVALAADGIAIGGNAFLTEVVTCVGAVSMELARIQGSIDLTEADLRNAGNAAFNGNGMTVGGAFIAEKVKVKGEIKLLDVSFRSYADFGNATLDNPGKSAMIFNRATIAGSVFCDKEFHCKGQINGLGAHIGGSLYFDGAELTHAPTQPVPPWANNANKILYLARLRVDGDVNLCAMGERSFSPTGEVDLRDAQIGGHLKLNGAKLTNSRSEKALDADRVHVAGDVYWNDGFTALGEVSLRNAEIGNSVRLGAGRLEAAGSALDASGAHVIRDVTVSKDLETDGRIGLTGAQVGGLLEVDTTGLAASGDPATAVDLLGVQADILRLRGSTPQGFVDLTTASVGVLQDEPGKLTGAGRPVLKGLTYGGIHRTGVPTDTRIHWLREGTQYVRNSDGQPGGYTPLDYVAQPYEALASCYQRLGDDKEAQRVLLEKCRARNRQTEFHRVDWYRRAWNKVQDIAVGYGYRPRRALNWIFGLWITGTFVFWHWLPPRSTVHPRQPFTFLHSIAYTLDVLVPAGQLPETSSWKAVGTGALVADVLTALGWGLAVTVIAAITRVLRRP